MSESSLAIIKPTEIRTETSTSLQATPGDLMSEPPPPYFQAWFMPGTSYEKLSQHLPCISDSLPQTSGKLAVSFNQPVSVLAFAANDPYYLVLQPIHNNTQKTGLQNQAKYIVIESKNPCLLYSLSELNDGMQDIPVRDIYIWIHRPNNHETISRLSRQSWKMEAPHIQKEYKTLAEIEKRNHTTAHPEYYFSLLNKREKPRTAKDYSQELALHSKTFSNFSQDSQPAAWAPLMDNNGTCECSTGTFPKEKGILWMSYPQITFAEHGSKDTQPRLPVTTGQTEIPATACLVSQPAAPGINAANRRSASLPLNNTAYNTRATAKAHPSQTSSFVVIGTFTGIPIPVTEAILECVNGSSCNESDFLTLFSEPTPLVNPTPSVSWIEAELAEMKAKDRHDPQHYESTSGDFSVHDRQMTGSSLDDVSCLSQDTHIGRRRPSRMTRTSNNKTPYINFITEASDLAASLREARSARNMLRRKGK
ncbi:uncharacterized protein BO88DRAFT_429987 [Aspergillus vadensis CBS 113365]|uniref:HMG box domain-containing protein n=1 Tax=Aspergillus vadensis (strain CBS 113365 / IMI 142717 / IBT 24658) TaxID=1448311 RepID=A0A319C5B7_ASPVC|nr:hypothetical protein BO88DRAFT_429987 [Aspergillus vadensis CBS 113365]PYH63972.1 hypothetical protein BO88DRAFT_429987 [Aspergillus vadensis CBS 113365]